MTRGKIIFIQNDMHVYVTCEFNGDMHPDRRGEEIFDSFQIGAFDTYQGYESFVRRFNRKFYGYHTLVDELLEMPALQLA